MSASEAREITLRPMTMDDVPVITRWFEHLPDLSLFDRALAIPLNEAGNKQAWEPIIEGSAPRRHHWFAGDDQEDNLTGIAGLSEINYIHGDAVAALFMSQQGRRQGIGLRMMVHIIDLGFNQLRLERLTTFCRSDNEASSEMMARLGFIEEGMLRRAWYSGGKHYDIKAVGILKEEWAAARKALEPELGNGLAVNLGRKA